MNSDFVKQVVNECRGSFKSETSLAQYCSWRIGGRAQYLYLPADLADLVKFMRIIPSTLPITWLGLGSNTLVRDDGVAGVVIITQGGLGKLDVRDNCVRAEAGVSAAQLARFSARRGLSGLEFMAGIPGTVGGALAMNAGCFGGETWQYVERVEMINRAGEIITRDKPEFAISYRHVKGRNQEWFVAGYFKPRLGNKQQALNTIKQLLDQRNQTQPTGTANCGSVFRNPPGDYAGRLIESCGLKGYRVGGARISEKHANFIINDGMASAADIEALISHVIKTVAHQTGIELNLEVSLLGTCMK